MLFDPHNPEAFVKQIAYLIAHPDNLAAFAQQDRFLPGAAGAIYGYYRRLEDRLLQLMD